MREPLQRLGRDAGQAGLDDAGVVQDQRIAGAHQVGQVGELQVAQPSRGIEVQQPARAAPGRRVLGDQPGRQRIVEIGDAHRRGL